jgi:hypothetical protein
MPRRYFYDIDRRGEVWHDGTMLTDEVFLRQFFRRLRRDERAAFADHPFVSPCAGEENRVRAEVTPIVFRRLIGSALLANGGASSAREKSWRTRSSSLERAPHAERVVARMRAGRNFMARPIAVEVSWFYLSRALRGWEPVVTSRNGAPDPVGGGQQR